MAGSQTTTDIKRKTSEQLSQYFASKKIKAQGNNVIKINLLTMSRGSRLRSERRLKADENKVKSC